MDQVLPAAGTDPELPHLMSVLIEAKDGSVRLVATDRFRLAIRDLVPLSLDRDLSAVVPAATLSQWRTSLDAPGELALNVDERHLNLIGGDVDLAAFILPTDFPDYERLLVPAEDVTRFAIDATGHAVGTEIVIDIDDPLAPVVFRSADDGTFTSRVMPVKLD